MSARRTFKRSARWLPVIALAVGLCMAAGPSDRSLAQGLDYGKTSRTGATTPSAEYVPGQVLALFSSGTSLSEARAAANGAEASVKRQVPRCWVSNGSRLMVVRSSTLSTPELVAALEADPAVVYAEPDYIRQPDISPNDTRFTELWGMKKIAATQAWNLTTGSAGVVVADIDSGADYNHPDLAANMWKNPGEFGKTPGVDDDGNGYVDDIYGIDGGAGDVDPMDDDAESEGHGSHTAGTIAAVGNNGVGVCGVCWTVRLMPLKFFGGASGGSTSAEIECINYAIWQKQHGVNVVAINASFGAPAYSQAERDAVQAAGNAGIVWVASAGNGGTDGVGDNIDVTPDYPSSYDCTNIISVAATGTADTLTSFSNYGAATVDLAAPGDSILSTVPTTIDPSGYELMPGTSMAAPHVTGTIALCADQFPADTVSQRINRVLANVDKVPALTGKCTTGGRLNVAKALGITPTTGPEILNLDSATHPDSSAWYASKTVGFSWEGEPKCSVASSLGWGGIAYGLAVADNTAYVADYGRGLQIVDVADPAQPVNLGAWEAQYFSPRSVAVEGNYAFANGYEPAMYWYEHRFMVILDVSDPSAPSLVAWLGWADGDNVWTVKEVAARGGYAYVGIQGVSSASGNMEYWLLVLDMSDPTVWADPAAGTVLGECQLSPGSASVTWSGFTLRGDYLYMGGDRLRIVDIEDPASPTVVGSAADPVGGGYCFDPEADDAHAFVACNRAMRVFDISQPTQPRSVAGWDIPSNYGIKYTGDRIAITDTDPALKHHYAFCGFGSSSDLFGYVYQVDISDPLAPANLGQVAWPGDGLVKAMTVSDDVLYIGRHARTGDEVVLVRLGPAGYSYVLDHSPGTVPDTTPDGTAAGLSADISQTAASDGVWYFHVRAIDSTGAAGPTVTRKVQIDSAGPFVTSNADSLPHRVFTLFLTADDGSGSGVAKVEYRIDNGAWMAGASVTLKCYGKRRIYAPGTHTVQYRATDEAGHVTSGSCQVILAR